MQRFVMKIVKRTRLLQRLGAAVAVAGPDEQAVAASRRKLPREVAPEADASEAFVKQHQDRCVRRPRKHPVLQPMPLDRYEIHVTHRSSQLLWRLLLLAHGASWINRARRQAVIIILPWDVRIPEWREAAR